MYAVYLLATALLGIVDGKSIWENEYYDDDGANESIFSHSVSNIICSIAVKKMPCPPLTPLFSTGLDPRSGTSHDGDCCGSIPVANRGSAGDAVVFFHVVCPCGRLPLASACTHGFPRNNDQ